MNKTTVREPHRGESITEGQIHDILILRYNSKLVRVDDTDILACSLKFNNLSNFIQETATAIDSRSTIFNRNACTTIQIGNSRVNKIKIKFTLGIGKMITRTKLFIQTKTKFNILTTRNSNFTTLGPHESKFLHDHKFSDNHRVDGCQP